MGGSVPGRTSLVRGSGLAVDVGVERSWRSHVEVFQQQIQRNVHIIDYYFNE